MTDDELRAELHGINGARRGIAGELRADIHDELRGMREELRATKEEIAIRMEQVETNLLTAFHSWASPMEMRQRGVKAVVSDFDDRLVMLEERVRKLEAGPNARHTVE